MTHQQSLARELSEWAMRLRFDQAPADARQAIANCLLYNLTMGLAVDDSNDQLGRALRSIADANGTARLFRGRGTRSAADSGSVGSRDLEFPRLAGSGRCAFAVRRDR